MTKKRVVLYIDEDKMARDTYSQVLQDCFGGGVVVEAVAPERDLATMLDAIRSRQSRQEIVSLVLDQRLKAAGTADFNGADLADALRRYFTSMPLYILTNYAEDVGDLVPSVEYVLSKDRLADGLEYQRAVAARVRRHVSLLDPIMSAEEARYDELLRKSLSDELTTEESGELEKLAFRRSKPTLADEDIETRKMRQSLDEQERTLNQIRAHLEKNRDKQP